jgi:hypothetical protein
LIIPVAPEQGVIAIHAVQRVIILAAIEEIITGEEGLTINKFL